jgi:hypothetical protein
MMRIRVLDDVDHEYAGERISLRAGDYVANPVRLGYAVPGRDITQDAVVSYVLEEGARRAGRGITAEAMEELRRLGLIEVRE